MFTFITTTNAAATLDNTCLMHIQQVIRKYNIQIPGQI